MSGLEKTTDSRTRRDFINATGQAIGGLAFAGVVANTTSGAVEAVDTTPKKIRIGVVGGGFGSMFQWHEHPDCIVEAVSDLRDDRRKYLMEIYKCSKSYRSLEELILDKNVDAVAVFTGAPDHAKHSIACMEAGKHVLSAVPAVMSIEEAEQLLATTQKTGLTYMMAETSYYHQSAITARQWFKEGKFGEIFYSEAEYHHASPKYPQKGSLQIDADGTKTWRYGYPPMLYVTHSTSLLIGTTGERLVDVMCLGWEYGNEGERGNKYKNPFRNATAFFKTDKGNGFRVSEFRYGAIPLTVNAKLYGTERTFLSRIDGIVNKPLLLTTRDASAKDDAGFAYQEAKIEEYDQTQWWKTDMLPEPLRHDRGGHDGSHPFLTHEFIDALVHDRQPSVNIYESLAYTVPGIVAHQSSLNGGAQMKIPRFDAD